MNIFDLLAQQGQPGEGQRGEGQPGKAWPGIEDAEQAQPEPPVCSRKGCRSHATMQLLWNNPKIHTAERRKIWLGCSDHAPWLEDYLQSRSLWKETLPLSPKDSA